MTALRIAPELVFPPEAVTETFAILAKRGVGKTYTSSVMAEEMISAGHQVCVVDPIACGGGSAAQLMGSSRDYRW